MKLFQTIAVFSICFFGVVFCHGPLETMWSKEGEQTKEILTNSIRKALDELPESFRIPESKKTETVAFISSLIFGYIGEEITNFEKRSENLATLGGQLLKDGAKLLVLRARWPVHQVEAAVDKLLRDYKAKLADPEISHNSRMSALDLEHIIQEILLTLSQDPSAVALFQWLSTLPASLHRIADELFTNKTFPEIFAMLGLNEEEINFETLLAPFNEELEKPNIDNKRFLGKLTHVVKAGINAIGPKIDKINQALQQMIAQKQSDINKLDLELREEMKIYNEALWKKITDFSLKITAF